MSLRIERIQDIRGLKKVFHLPLRLYREDPNWVCPLWGDFKHLFKPENPFFRHARVELFSARENGELLGSIAYIQDENYIRFHEEKIAFFGFFECENRPEVAAALFSTVEEEARKAGLLKMAGPMNPSTNETCGLLVEGFDSPPNLMMPYNPPWYAGLLEGQGYAKAMDLFAYIAPVTGEPLKRLERIARGVYAKGGVTVRPVNLNKLEDEIQLVRSIYNSAWEKNWGFVPMTEEEMLDMAKRLKQIVIPQIVQIAFVNNDPAAFLMTLPNANEVLIHLKGHLTPWAMAKAFYWSKKIRSLRLVIMGVKPEYRMMGLDACLYYEGLKEALKMNFTEVETSWILEDNVLMQKAVRLLGGRKYKTYRLYQKTL